MRKRLTGALLVGSAVAVGSPPSEGATVFQPDVRLGVSYLENAGFTGAGDFNTTGVELQAKANIGFVSERDTLTLTPMIRVTEYEEEGISEREEQRLRLKWFRNFQTGAAQTTAEFLRQDLFSSEFLDPLTDPDEIPDPDDASSGFVDVESTRNRAHFRQDFARSIGLRNDIALGLDFVDITYDDSGATPRIDYNEIQLDAGWFRSLTERTRLLVAAGLERYDADNGLTADSVSGEVGFDVEVSETASLSALAGLERSERENQFQDLGTDNEFIFRISGEKLTELTRFNANVFRNVRPTSIGGLTTATGVSLLVDRQLSPRTSFGAGVSAFRQERGQGASLDDRDFVSGQLRLSWQLSREWFLEASARHTRQDFDSRVLLDGRTTEDRSKLLLNLRYRGQTEVPALRDRRFLKGY